MSRSLLTWITARYIGRTAMLRLRFAFPALLAACFVSGCASVKILEPVGGSRADGIVLLAYDYGLFENPQPRWDIALNTARQRCGAWGYSEAQPFGGGVQQCLSSDAQGNCLVWRVTIKYQCQTQAAERPEPSAATPAVSQNPHPSIDVSVVRIMSGRSVGSGFFVTEDLLATNAHVVQGSKQVDVLFSAGAKGRGSVVYKNDSLDFALIRASAQGAPLPFRNTALVDGEAVLAVGFPQGRQIIAGSTGTVRKLVECCIEHDALVAGGSSGGPLLDANSNVIGINTLLVKAKGDRKNETDRTWALKMSYIFETLRALGERDTSAYTNPGNTIPSGSSAASVEYNESASDRAWSGRDIAQRNLKWIKHLRSVGAMSEVEYRGRRERLLAEFPDLEKP